MPQITYSKNEELNTILKDWKGNPVINGKFVDPNTRFSGTFSRFLRWQFTRNDKRTEKKNEKWRLKVHRNTDFLQGNEDRIVWLGHASFFMQFNGTRILIDPIFGRISGIVPRYSELPCAAEDFGNIDYVLLSHAHRDHCDSYSLRKLYQKNKFTLLTSLNTAELVLGWLPDLNYQEA